VNGDGGSGERRAHWDEVYERTGEAGGSWHEPEPACSLALIDALRLGPEASVVDVGGGASRLAGALVARGFTDVTVLDLSVVALRLARRRLGAAAAKVRWLAQDVLLWRPERRYDLWHDRAVFHFLVDGDDRRRYVEVLRSALRPGGRVVIATFAPDGPDRCSGLPVARYGAADLAAALGSGFRVVEARRQAHRTPDGAVQPFTWLALASSAGSGPGTRRPRGTAP
jgi:SAM-dependent methyltransferase